MAGRVFISCGQANVQEIGAAKDISAWLRSQGFDPYVAIETQSILDLNSGIIGELKKADFYLFINFRRDYITNITDKFYRGSVFTNQELGIAYAMGFEKCLFINQEGVKREGIFQYMVSNTPEFDNLSGLLPIVQDAVTKANWQSRYSRNLVVQGVRWGGPVTYTDHGASRFEKVLHVDVKNNRPDQGASNTVARLKSISINGVTTPAIDRSHLKCSGAPGYTNTIWPEDHVAFDLLAIDLGNPKNLYLHSALDVFPRSPFIQDTGTYTLTYQVFAESFPPVIFSVLLNATGDVATISEALQ